MTDRERIMALNRKLDQQLAEFDGLLLQQRLRLKAQARAAGRSGIQPMDPAGASDNRTGTFTSPPTPRAGVRHMPASGGGGMPEPPADRPGGEIGNIAGLTPVPTDIPNRNEDDVVARQLREAAMKEPDPELRRKLWNEYRKYQGLPLK